MTVVSQRSLTAEIFRQHPVWAWDAAMESHEPVLEYEPLPTDRGGLFIAARFVTPTGVALHGYLIGGENPFGVGIFVGDDEVLFNVNVPSLIEEHVEKLRSALGDDALEVFPLKYRSSAGFKKQPELEGLVEPVR